jgi:hypothetical protein
MASNRSFIQLHAYHQKPISCQDINPLLPNRIRRTQPLHQMVLRRHHHFAVLCGPPSARSSACCVLAHNVARDRLQQDVVQWMAEICERVAVLRLGSRWENDAVESRL